MNRLRDLFRHLAGILLAVNWRSSKKGAATDGDWASRPGIALFVGICAALASPTAAEDTASAIAEVTRDGFYVTTFVTPLTEPKFHALWDTPRATSPDIPTTDEVNVGQHFSVIVLFGGAKRNDGVISLTCKTDLVLPDGSRQSAFNGSCMNKAPAKGGPPNEIFAAENGIGLNAPPELAGKTIQIEQVITDENAHISVQLVVSVKVRRQTS